MKLVEQLLREAGADVDKSFTVIPSFGGYFKSVKRVEDYSPQKIVLALPKLRLVIVGEKLVIDKYFQQDLLVRGRISGVTLE